MKPTTYRILVGSDFSESASLALDSAVDEALRRTDAELHVVSVVEDGGHHILPSASRHETRSVELVRELLSGEVGAAIARRAGEPAAPPSFSPVVHVRVGSAPEQIAALANELHADLVILGTHGRRGVQRALMGSVAERTVRLAPCPVLVVRAKDFGDALPVLDPACPACLAEREASHGERWWCAEHAERPDAPHGHEAPARLDNPPTSTPYLG